MHTKQDVHVTIKHREQSTLQLVTFDKKKMTNKKNCLYQNTDALEAKQINVNLPAINRVQSVAIKNIKLQKKIKNKK